MSVKFTVLLYINGIKKNQRQNSLLFSCLLSLQQGLHAQGKPWQKVSFSVESGKVREFVM